MHDIHITGPILTMIPQKSEYPVASVVRCKDKSAFVGSPVCTDGRFQLLEGGNIFF